MRGHHLNEKVDIIFISIKIHKFIVDGLCFFLLKFQFLVMMNLK